MNGDYYDNLLEILAVVIILSPISSVCGVCHILFICACNDRFIHLNDACIQCAPDTHAHTHI